MPVNCQENGQFGHKITAPKGRGRGGVSTKDPGGAAQEKETQGDRVRETKPNSSSKKRGGVWTLTK